MSKEKDSKLKALQLTLDKLDKTYGKGTVMKMGDVEIVKIKRRIDTTNQERNDLMDKVDEILQIESEEKKES